MENSGQLNRYVEVQDAASGVDANSYVRVRDQWVSIAPLTSNRMVFLAAQGSKVTHVITAREKPPLIVGQRIVYRGLNYKITAVQTVIGDRQEAQAELLL